MRLTLAKSHPRRGSGTACTFVFLWNMGMYWCIALGVGDCFHSSVSNHLQPLTQIAFKPLKLFQAESGRSTILVPQYSELDSIWK